MIRRSTFLLPLALVAGLAGCGGSSSSGGGGAYGSAAASPAATTSATSTQVAATAAPPVALGVKRTHFGDVLAVGHGRLTVYEFGADRGSNSACSGACAAAWPPVTGHAVAGPGVRSSLLGTIRRPDGRVQVTYRGHPLYRFIKDRDDGDTYGQGSRAFGASWYALRSSGAVADTT